MVSDAADGPEERPDRDEEADAHAAPANAADASVVDRWTALDRGWQALALGLGIVAAHIVGQAL
ncbi:hypothetical protein ABNG03_04040 [Halorubrum sp. RMP-47]|uniref:Uncharacterized protein n=1 Tax=Halorubrum miltondacostae TaxID=3076378 RepID=A0ABD5M662_9EURY